MASGRFFEDFEVGALGQTDSRIVTQSDVEAFALVSGDRNPLHLDETYAAQTEFGGRIAHGLLGLSVTSGLLNRSQLTAGTLLAFLGLTWEFREPLRPGAAVHVSHRVLRKRGTQRVGRGIVVLDVRLLDEADDTIQEGEFKLLVKCRKPAISDRADQAHEPGGAT